MATPKTVLITGANGFIGSRLCRQFLSEGYRVTAGVRRSSKLALLDGLSVDFCYGDVTEPGSLPAMVTGVDIIIHNAGVVKANTEEQFYAINETGTRNLFEAVALHNPNVERVVYISSLAAVGPSTNGLPLTEAAPTNPLTTYGKSKLAGENVALGFADRLSVVAVRPPGVYGPGDKELFSLFQALHRRVKPFIGDSGRMMQLVHVDDLCRGIFLAGTKSVESGSVYFIAEREAYSLNKLMAVLEEASGKKALPLHLPGPLFRAISAISEAALRLIGATPMLTREKTAELLASWTVDTSRAQRELGFVSAIPLAIGAQETFAWYRKEGWL